MPSDSVVYQEEQRFKQWWLWLIVYGVAALMWWALIQQVVLGQPWGTNPGPDWLIWLFWLLFGLGLPALFHATRLVVEVHPDQVMIRYWPFTIRRIAIVDIKQMEVRTYKPVQEYGGWGIKGWSSQRIAYNVSGNRGVELTLQDGRSVMIGSQQPEALALAIQTQLELRH